MFIVFEGIDGTGKTTQMKLLAEKLRQQGRQVVETFEPTAGVYGKKLRQLFRRRDELSLQDELDLFIADRREHVATLISPGIAAGHDVLCDRYYLSTAAYQGARGGDVAAIIDLNRAFAPEPDLFVILETPVTVGRTRISAIRGEEPNDFEQADYLERVGEIFRQLRRDNIIRINAAADINTVHRRIMAVVDNFLMDS